MSIDDRSAVIPHQGIELGDNTLRQRKFSLHVDPVWDEQGGVKDDIPNRNFQLRILRGTELNRFHRRRDGTRILWPIDSKDGIKYVFDFLIGLHPLYGIEQQRITSSLA